MASSLVVNTGVNRQRIDLSSTNRSEGVAVDTEDKIIAEGGLSDLDLVKMLEASQFEPKWRLEADRCADYYDGNQLDSETLELMRQRNVPPLIINLIQPTINTVLGMEARERTDCKVTFDEPEFEQVAIALNKKLVDFQHGTVADRAISDAYAGQVKAGLHWVEVNRNPNPMAECQYRCKAVHRREIWWDWSEAEPDDWRYLIRKRWIDSERLQAVFPQHKDLIGYSANRWSGFGRFTENLFEKTGLGKSYDIERAFTVTENEWRDTERNRLVTFEVWYRVWRSGFVATMNDGKRIALDTNNPRHSALIAAGVLRPMRAVYPVMRQSFFVGPHRILDRPSPLPHDGFPYTPFFGFREDLTRAPYGLIRAMISPQDEINARRSRLMALLGSRRMQLDSDALDQSQNSIDEAADEVSRSDSVLVLNPNRKNKQHGVLVEDNSDLSAGQANILAESKNEIRMTSGVFAPMQGENQAGMAGITLNGLVQQGTTTLAEINDNYQHSRRDVYGQALSFIKADSLHEHTVGVGEGRNRKSIFLNKPVIDPSTQMADTVNQVAGSDARVVLEDVPSSASYRQQQFAQLSEITKSLPPAIQAFIVPFVMEATDLKDRKLIASTLRKQMGMPEPGMGGEDQPIDPMQNPQVQQMQQQYEQAIQQISQQMQEAMQEIQQLKLANADKSDANDAKRMEVQGKVQDSAASTQVEREKLASNERIKQMELEHERDMAFLTQVGGATDDAKADQESGKELLASIMDELKPALKTITTDLASLRKDVDSKLSARP